MLRHKKEMKQHRLAEFRKKCNELDIKYRYKEREYISKKILLTNDFWQEYYAELRKLQEEYGMDWDNRDLVGFYMSRVAHKPHRTNPKHDRARRCSRAATKNGIKPLKQQFKEEIEDYDPEGDEIYYTYCSGNY